MNDDTQQHGAAIALQPMRPTEILGTAFELYRRHWRTLIAIMASSAVPLATALSLRQQCQQGGSCQTYVLDRVVVSGMPASWWATTASGVVLGVVFLLLVSFLAGVITRAVAAAVAGEDPGVAGSYRFGVARLGSLLLVGVLVYLTVVVGLFLLVIPGIILGVGLVVSIPALVVEGRRGSRALSRSWSLVSGRWWHTFGTLILAWLVLSILTAVLRGVVNLIASPLGDWGWVVQALPAAVATMLLLPYGAAVLVLLYLDLQARKQPLDLDTLKADLHASVA
jgi:hypothetical protein